MQVCNLLGIPHVYRSIHKICYSINRGPAARQALYYHFGAIVYMVRITINGTPIEVREGSSILEAADQAEIYIPRICSHPDIPPVEPESLLPWDVIFQGDKSISNMDSDARYEGCQLCVVQVNGLPDLVRACVTKVEDGMEVVTSSDQIDSYRKYRLKDLFATHPHACVQCAQNKGCALEPCSTNVDKSERCCPIFHVCELRDVAAFVGIPADTSRYIPENLPKIESEPLFLRDHNLCINCLRCVRVCRDVRNVDVYGYVINENGKPVVGTKAATIADSGCRFCLSCVEVCPTGTLRLKFEDPRINSRRVALCVSTCPANMDVPRYLREIRRGEFARADAVIRETAPLPRSLGQVCFHPCEVECIRDKVHDAIAICSLKRAASEYADESLWRSGIGSIQSTGKKVAIIGAGPSGLTAAWFLKLKGHDVEVFESHKSAGGWLRNGIPRYRLSLDALDADIADIASIGVDIKTGTEVGKDIAFDEIRNGSDAVLIAAGARKPKTLPCEGVDLPGVEFGLEALKDIQLTIEMGEKPFAGEKMIIIGGGNVAIDVARTARRLGPSEIHMYCLESRDEMPAHDWEIEEAEREGIMMHPGWGPKLMAGDGKVKRVEFRKCVSVFDESGRFSPKFDENETTSQDADHVLIAIGQDPSIGFLETMGDIKLKADRDSMQTSVKGIFAAGEVVSGPASVIDAIADGRRAASEIDKYLGGDGNIDIRLIDDTELDGDLGVIEGFATLDCVSMPRLPDEIAVDSFDLLEKGYSREEAIREAERCLRCDIRLLIGCPPAPPESWLEMTEESINSVPESEGVYQLLDENKEIYAIKGEQNLRGALLGILETTEKARFFLFDVDPMYSKRESELIQEYLKEHGSMPPGEGEDDLDDLF